MIELDAELAHLKATRSDLVSTKLGAVPMPVSQMYQMRVCFLNYNKVRWDKSGIAIWFFPRGNIPQDLESGAPKPDSWPNPMGRWPASSCDPFKFFYDHIAIFDTTLWYFSRFLAYDDLASQSL